MPVLLENSLKIVYNPISEPIPNKKKVYKLKEINA